MSNIVGRFEELILICLSLAGRPYSAKEMINILNDNFNKQVSTGALYMTLDRLETKGLIYSTNNATDGKTKRLFALTKSGERSLKEARNFSKLVENIASKGDHPIAAMQC